MKKKLCGIGILMILCCLAMTLTAYCAVSVSEQYIDGVKTVVLLSDTETAAVIYTASYDADGRLERIDMQSDITLTAGVDFITEVKELTDGAKLFVWDNELTPLCAVYCAGTNVIEGDGIIHLNGDSIDARGVAGATVYGTVVTINEPGDYVIEGTLEDGQIVVSDELGKKDAVAITLQGVDVTCSDSAAFNGGGGAITLTLADGTENTFTDTAQYTAYTTEKEPKGCVYARRDFDIAGSGTLIVKGNVKNGLVCGADLKIKKGANLDIQAVNNGIKGDNGVEFTGKTGTVKVVTSEGDAIKSDAIIELDDGTQLIEQDKGYVVIDGGIFELHAAGDGIQADNFCTISGGEISILSGAEGIKANEVLLFATEDEETQAVDADGNGIFVSGKIEISGGVITITSGEDGIKACEVLTVSGGTTTIDANGTEADAIQVGESTKQESSDASGATTTTETVIVPGKIMVSGGSITVSQATDDGIVCRGEFIMTDGSVAGNAACDFMKIYDLVEISGGKFDITAGNDGIQAGKELVETVSGTVVTESNPTIGNVSISGGEFYIVTNGGHTVSMLETDPSAKGIKAMTELNISGGTFVIDSADDAVHSNYNLTVTSGDFELATGDDGLHADFILTMGTENGNDDDYNINITASYEGIEGSVINLLSGTSYIYSNDDGINAAGDYNENGELYTSTNTDSSMGGGNMGPNQGGDDSAPCGMLYVKGGRCYVEAYGDGMDSNGNIDMSHGIVIINGPTSGGNGVFDIGENNATFKITGGTLIGAGASDMAVTPTTISNGYFLSGKSSNASNGGRPSFGGNSSGSSSGSSSYTAGTPIKITTSNGNIVFIPKVNSAWLFVTTPEMASGGTFTATANASYTGGTEVFGITQDHVYYGLVENVQ